MYIRKTKDIFTVQGLYYGQWEDETSEETRREAIERLKEYRLNMPEYAHRLIKTREKIELYRSNGKFFKSLDAAKEYANAIHTKTGVILGIEKV
jgi:hypothetical protein